MGRSPPTEERAAACPSLVTDPALRLQQRVTGWRGAERGQPLSVLHNECLNAVGPGGSHLLPTSSCSSKTWTRQTCKLPFAIPMVRDEAPSFAFVSRRSGALT